jgi:hypothetical protein
MALCYERFPLIPVPRTLLPRIVFFDDIIFVASLEVQTHHQINCATRELSLPAEVEDLNVPSIALYLEVLLNLMRRSPTLLFTTSPSR